MKQRLGIALIPEINSIIDTLVNLSPLCLSRRIATYNEVFSLGTISVTQLDIGFVVYLIMIVLLFMRVKKVYEVK